MKILTRKFIRNAVLSVIVIAAILAVIRIVTHNDTPKTDEPLSSAPANPLENGADTSVYLYFADKNNELLNPEQQMIAHPESSVEFARIIIARLTKGSQHGLGRTIPAETVLKAIYMMKDGTVVADFSKEISEKQPGGVQEEYLTVISIANSLVMNIPEMKRVKILIEGKESATLSGHIDISEPFGATMLPVK